MDPLELALVILVSLWSLIFLILGIALIVIMKQVTQALEKINRILQTAENVSEGVGVPLKVAASSLMGFMRKDKPRDSKKLHS